ncbi:MAG: ATP-dependent DNA helicase [Lachnospiraceae bacterium]|nr:ATP-dependent DNA helicase [Lachnospiraceae bacterium]
MEELHIVRVSVRELVESVLRSGDIDNRRKAGSTLDAMNLGSKVHRLLQKSRAREYRAEVPLSISLTISEDPLAELRLEGRADGILDETDEAGGRHVLVEEIKGVFLDIHAMEAPLPVHLAQAVVYGYLYSLDEQLPELTVRMTYAALKEADPDLKKLSESDIRYFDRVYTFEALEEAFQGYVDAYRRWAVLTVSHRLARRASAEGFAFPYAFRPGQKAIVSQVYKTVRDGKRLFVEAPTGIGKTLAMLYPSVRAVGMGQGDKIFYLTGKTVTGNAAEEAMRIFSSRGLAFSFVRVTAKEKLCPLGKCDCNPDACPYAKGHFDRVNDAVFDAVANENLLSAEVLSSYAELYRVCPYEFCLDVTLHTDVVICDYNYAFAPHVLLQRYFGGGKGDYIFLVDEAHNLVDRGRDMFSASIVKEDVLAAKKLFPGQKTILKWLERTNRSLLALKKETADDRTVFTADDFPNDLVYDLTMLREAMTRYLDRNPGPGEEGVLDFYFRVGDFVDTYAYLEDGYIPYAAFDEERRFFVKLFCIHPAARLLARLENVRAAVFFSATFLPIRYYKELLTNDAEEDAIYVDSPFDPRKRALLIARDVSSLYRRRNEAEYRKIASAIRQMVCAKPGHYLAFFPSHRFLEEVGRCFDDEEEFLIVRQEKTMSEPSRQAFLDLFRARQDHSLLGLCVTGGVFAEGIDLAGENLIGVAVVGTGLPQVCTERELIRAYFEKRGRNGFDYAYRFPGFNRVLQAAGRLIRTADDEGVVLLLDERFTRAENRAVFPKEWADYQVIPAERTEEAVRRFWSERGTAASAGQCVPAQGDAEGGTPCAPVPDGTES